MRPTCRHKIRILFGAILVLSPLQAQGEFYSDCSHPIMRLRFEISTCLQPTTGLTGFTRLRCGRNLATDGADCAVRKTTLKSPDMPPDQSFLKGLSPRKGRETIQLIGYSLSLFNLYHFAEGCVPKVPEGYFS